VKTDILTIGHSSLLYPDFLQNLRNAGVTAIADVRSSPFSRHFPQFNRDVLERELKTDGIAYSFLGDQLGGRPKAQSLYRDGVANYQAMALEPTFRAGLDRVIEGGRKYRIALMCSEQDPLDCHRCLLVGRALTSRSVSTGHILGDGTTIDQAAVEEALLKAHGGDHDDLFASRAERIDLAYQGRARKVAYQADDSLKKAG
jgi:uncharacterized protein (DUF488 family)